MNVSFLFSLLVILGTHLHATQVIPHPVDPQIGENLWGMNYRQSIAIDDILDTTTLCCNCDFFITQDDIDGNGGGFAITQPGNWCLGENIITTAPITISGMQGVVFDLKGRSISSTVNNSQILSITNSPGTIVQNGSIIGLDLGASFAQRTGIALGASPDSLVSNIRVSFLGSVDDPTISQGGFGFESDGNVLFNNCFATGPYLFGFVMQGDTNTLLNCEVIHFSADLVLGTSSRPGLGFYMRGTNHYLENCKAIGGDAQPTTNSAGSSGFYINANNTIMNNCTALNHQNITASPFFFFYPAGSGFYVTGNNCQINNCTSAYNEAFGIFNSGTGLLVCDNSVFYNGTNYSGTANTNLCNLLCDDYISQDRIPYTISQPGVYCFNGNIQETAGNTAIIIQDGTSNVTIDFSRYTLARTSTANNQPLITVGTGCSNITITNGQLSSTGSSNFNNIGIATSLDVTSLDISNLALEGFNIGIFLNNPNSDISIDSCTGSNNFKFFGAQFCNNIAISNCTISNGGPAPQIYLALGTNITIDGVQVTNSASDAFNIIDAVHIDISNCFISSNGGHGINIQGGGNISLDSIITVSNASSGIYTIGSTNIVLNGCTSQFNSDHGFEHYGVHQVATPMTINSCYAQGNKNTGFYFQEVNGLAVLGCTSMSNGDQGFWLNTGTTNAKVQGCIALYNGHVGFITADIVEGITSPANTRFTACHAALNYLSGTYVPGATDYSMGNVEGVAMLPPIAGPVAEIVAMTPPPVVSVFGADYCTYL